MKILLAAGVMVAALAALAFPADAQQLTLQMADGRVTLNATNASARQILTEWAKVGGTKVVGAEKMPGVPLTLKLVDVPERQALDIILRSAAGFMAAERAASAAPGASKYDRIMVMATSTSAVAQNANGRPGTGSAADNAATNGLQRRVNPPRPPNLPPSPADDNADADSQTTNDPADNGLSPAPVFTFPAPGQAPGAPGTNGPVFVPMQNGGTFVPGQNGTFVPGQNGTFVPNGQTTTYVPGSNGSQFQAPGQQPGARPVITLQPGPNGPTIYNFVPTAGAPIGAPTPGFTVIGSPTPGVITNPPPAPGTPIPPTRPPGV